MKGKGPRDLQILRQATKQRIRQLEKEKQACDKAAAECAMQRRVAANQRVAEKLVERRQRAEERLKVEQEIKRRSGRSAP